MARFDRAIQTALRLIKKNGESVVWGVGNDSIPPDSTKPWRAGFPTGNSEFPVICFLPIDRQTMETFSFVKGIELQKGNVLGLMGQVSFEPNLKDLVLRNNGQDAYISYRILSIDVLSPNGQKILYTIIFQK